MRSYFLSLTFVACLIGGYTAIMMTSKKADTHKPTAAVEMDSREPAQAAIVDGN